MKLDIHQKEQEKQYGLPYHWFFDPTTVRGREYFGYLKKCVQLLPQSSQPLRVLDAGCGDGRFMRELIEAGHETYGVDYSDRAIQFAQVLLPTATFAVADLRELPYDDDYFDAIYLIDTLEHIQIDVIPSMMAELERIMKPGAQLVVTVPSRLVPLHKKHYQHFTVESLTRALADNFEVTSVTGQYNFRHFVPRVLYKFLDNRYWLIKQLARWFNTQIWPKYYNDCAPEKAFRLIAVATKK